ncbi:MAG: HNH endonuclease [Candidatus Accumulibacter sp.]|jgi:hypothetical protein|nr:HNH endonuclease [Accumulibacter sp.]
MNQQKFASKLAATPIGCLEWTGYTVKSNGRESHRYGRIKVGGRDILAHRYAYKLAHGEIPRGMSVCHRCDNPKCCNPEHLFLGTHRQNMGDMAAKGRAARISNPKPTGEKSPTAKLLDTQIEEIRARRAAGETVTSLAAAYGVHHSYVSRLARGIRR